jgi:hypothetical protein
MVDGYFFVDETTKAALEALGVEVLRGADIGLPQNRLLTVIRFRASKPSLDEMKEKWDAVATARKGAASWHPRLLRKGRGI